MPPPPVAGQPTDSSCTWQEPWAQFAHWAAARLGLAMEFDGRAYSLGQLPEGAPQPAEPTVVPRSGLGSSLLSLRKRHPKTDAPAVKSFASPGELAQELLTRLGELSPPPDLAPCEQPERVHDLAPTLLGAYQVDNGRLHIAGCHFEDVPFVRVTASGPNEQGEPAFQHTLFDRQGEPVGNALAIELGLTANRDIDYHPAGDHRAPALAEGSVVSGVVWAKRVGGNLQFTIGEHSLSAPFAGWARSLRAPAVVCPQTGRETFHLAALEGVGIVAAEEIAHCELSGRALLRRELVRCSVTGKQAAPELCEPCPVSGEPTLSQAFITCPRCGQRVSQAVIQRGRCAACRSLRRAPAGDPSLVAILAAHPTLGQLKRWRIAETHSAYLLQGSRGLARYLLVFDRDNLGILEARRLRALSGPAKLTPEERLWLLAS